MRRVIFALLLTLAGCTSPGSGPPTGQPLAEDYLKRGYFHLLTRDASAALADFDHAIAAAPKLAAAYTGRGRAWMQLQQYDRAIEDLTQAIALGPSDVASAYSSRGRAWAAAGDDKKAIEDYARAIALDPKYWLAYFGRAVVLARIKDNDKALADLDRALALDPGADESDLDPDASMPTNASPDAPTPATAPSAPNRQSQYYTSIIRFVRGQVLIQKGSYQPALVDLDEALRLEPKFAEARVYHGLAQMGLSRCDAGRDDLLAAADLAKVSLGRILDAHRTFINATRCAGESL